MALVSLNIAQAEGDPHIHQDGHGLVYSASGEIEELPDDPVAPEDELNEAEDDNKNDVLDKYIDVADTASTISNESVPAADPVVEPALTPPTRNRKNRDDCPSPVPSWHGYDRLNDSDQKIHEATYP